MGRGHDSPPTYEYDVAFSFAGEDRKYVEQVATALRGSVRVFYDQHEKVSLWGKNLQTYLDVIYRRKARYCVLFISEHYARKLWTNHERQSAQARALSGDASYILPARFDDTEIPGVLPTIGYVDLRTHTPEQFAKLIRKKLGASSGPGAPSPGPEPNTIPAEAEELPPRRGLRAALLSRLPLVGAALVGFSLLAAATAYLSLRPPRGGILVEVTPEEARLRLNDRAVPHGAIVHSSPGQYMLSAEAPGYEPSRQWVRLEEEVLVVRIHLKKVSREEQPPPRPTPVAPAPSEDQPAPAVKLDAVLIQQVLARGSGPILQCFEEYKSELPSPRGEVKVHLTILQSGQVVGTQTLGALSGSRVGNCLEQRVGRLRFPRHVDKEINLAAPFQYRVVR